MKSVGELLGGDGTEHKPYARLPQWNPSDQGYDPEDPEHAPALRLFPGSKYVRVNRYRTPEGFLVDRLGAQQNPLECPECGSVPGVSNFRYHVREPRSPARPPWESTFRPCSRCVTPEEIRENEAFMSGQPPARR